MKSSTVLYALQQSVSTDEYHKLSDHTLPHISDFNRQMILDMLQLTSLPEEDIAQEKITALKNTLEEYLRVYLSDQEDAWKWIILSCIYRCFICHKPLHAQEMAHYVITYQHNVPVYYCPLKSTEGTTACSFCICQKA